MSVHRVYLHVPCALVHGWPEGGHHVHVVALHRVVVRLGFVAHLVGFLLLLDSTLETLLVRADILVAVEFVKQNVLVAFSTSARQSTRP